MNRIAIFTKNLKGNIQGIASICNNEKGCTETILCYPYRDSEISEGVVLFDDMDISDLKTNGNGSKYAFIKGCNVTTSTINNLNPLTIKRAMFEQRLVLNHNLLPANGGITLMEYNLNGNTIYEDGIGSLYAAVDNMLYIINYAGYLMPKFIKNIDNANPHPYTMTTETSYGINFLNRSFQLYSRISLFNFNIDLADIDVDTLSIFKNNFAFIHIRSYDNQLLSKWFDARRVDCIPNALGAMFTDATISKIRSEPEAAFNELLILDRIREARLTLLLEKLAHRVQCVKTRTAIIKDLIIQFPGSKALYDYTRKYLS